MKLPVQKTDDQDLMLMQNAWKSKLDPVLGSPIATPSILVGIQLATGANVINHKLGRLMQGWMLTDINGSALVYRSGPLNSLTLTLTSSAPVTCNILVF